MNRTKLIVILSIVVLGSLSAYFNRGFKLDDALIYHRYIDNFIEGKGLVYNEGERFNALTSPLYVYTSVLFSSITGEVEITQTVLSGALLILAAIFLLLLFELLNMRTIGYIASLLLVTAKYFYVVFGMESNMFVLLSILCIYFYFRKDLLWLAICSALLILTRGEGVFLLVVLYFFILRENRKDLKIIHFAVFATILLCSYLFNYYYYGQFFPHTLTAKIAQGRSGLWGNFGFLAEANFLIKAAFNNQGIFVFFLLNIFIIGLIRCFKTKLDLILFANVNLITLFYLSLNMPNYHWYYTMHMLLFYVFVSYGSLEIYNYVKTNIAKPFMRYAVLLLIFAYPIGTQVQMFILLQKHEPFRPYKEIGEWLRNTTPPDSKVAAVEIGHIGWYSERYIIDILGLVNPHNAEFIGERKFSKWFDLYKPDYILIHDPSWGHEQGVLPLLDSGYFKEDTTFIYRGYKMLVKTGK